MKDECACPGCKYLRASGRRAGSGPIESLLCGPCELYGCTRAEARCPDGMGRFFYEPSDVDDAHDDWGANCGPCALAALLGSEVNAIRDLLGSWPGYTNPTMMRAWLNTAGFPKIIASKEPGRFGGWLPARQLRRGVAFVQWEGPWEKGGERAAYRHTHWVTYHMRQRGGEETCMVYDSLSGWLPVDSWDKLVTPLYLAKKPKATGWRFRLLLDVGIPHDFEISSVNGGAFDPRER